MFRVALINPSFPLNEVWVREGRCQQEDIWGAPYPPLSLAYISSALSSSGVETRIFDSAEKGKGPAHMIKEIGEFSPSLAIMTTATPTIESDGEWFAPMLKENIPQLRIAVTGIHVTALPQETLERYPFFDFAIIGEPEITARELALSLIINSDLRSVKGLSFRKGESIVTTEERAFIDSLDDLNFPDWKGIEQKNYRLPIVNRPFSLIEIERGCPFSCRFCASHAYHGQKLRKRSINKIIEEINLYTKKGINDFLFWAESFTLDREYLELFLRAIRQESLHKKIRWVCNSRVDSVDRKILGEMKETGCWQIAFGLEFGNEKILRLSRKAGNSSLKKGEETVCLADEAGIIADGHFMIGFPGETEETMQDTINYACRLPLTFAHFYSATPFPGSPLFEEALANGWLKKEDMSKISQSSCVLDLPGLDPELGNHFIRKAYRAFYLRPVTFFRIAKIPGNFSEWLHLCRLGMKSLRSYLL
jgi:anaerobic magnesium-protoporphyrin IX monomethyl ester cyclase